MAVIYGDDTKDLFISGTLTFNTIHDFPPADPQTITFGDQDLSGTQASIVYGDLRNLTLEAKAVSNQTDPGVWLVAVDSYTFNFGDDKLSFGNKNNTLFGDMQDLYLHAVGGITAKGVVVDAWISQNTFNYGDDLISAGNGNNTVYGDARDVTLLGERSINLDSSVAPFPLFEEMLGGSAVPWFNTLNYGSDKITLGNGSNTVCGDVQDINLEGLTGITHVVTGTEGQGIADGPLLNAFTFGSDQIAVGNGVNVIYGDFRNILELSNGGKTVGQENGTNTDTNGILYLNTYNFGNDIIKIGDGNNILYGDGRNLELLVTGSQAIGGAGTYGYVEAEVFTFGNDAIMAAASASAAGHNIVYGDLQNLTFDVEGGHAVDASFEAGSQIRLNTFVMGADSITLGNGGNQIYGDMNDYSIHTEGGVNADPLLFIRHSAVTGNDVQMGDDTITSGSGADLIYADAHNVDWEAEGGIATVYSAPASLSIRSESNPVPDSIAFGADSVHAGGGNDLIAGDALDISVKAIGGQASQDGLNAMGWINAVTLVGGDDELHGESGADTMYGDMRSLSLSVEGGMVSGSGGDASAHMINTVATMGADNISGGDGNDILYGDLANLSFSAVAGKDTSGVGDVSATFSGDVGPFDFGGTVTDTGSTIALGDDVIDGGAGNDFISGDALNVTGADLFLTGLNQILGGDDTLTGGAGADTFAFSLAISFGDDTITDFSNAEADVLQFNSAGNLNALKAISHVENDGTGHCLFVVDSGAAAGSSISFANIAYTTQTEIDQIVTPANIHVS